MVGLSISTTFATCLDRFNQILSSGILLPKESEVPLSLWEDELGRLRVWASNIGAHKKGQSSLDYRLRDASLIKNRVIEILRDLKKLFDDLEEILAEPAADDEVSDGDSDDEFDGMTEVQMIYDAILRAVTCLFRMSMAIRQPAPLDRISGSHREDITAFEPYDRLHVRNKFPRADSGTVERLGSAISKRRAALRYRERHHAKLSQEITSEAEMEKSTTISETVATEFQESLTLEDTHSEASASQTSYAGSLFESKDHLIVPPRPKESADGNPFECPYCYFIITVKDRGSWARHIFYDLLPYMCILPDCNIPNKLFASRREWYAHIRTKHLMDFTEDIRECPLCKDILQTSQIERHLARHLEDLALFALPVWKAEESEGTEENDGVHDSSGNSSVENEYREAQMIKRYRKDVKLLTKKLRRANNILQKHMKYDHKNIEEDVEVDDLKESSSVEDGWEGDYEDEDPQTQIIKTYEEATRLLRERLLKTNDYLRIINARANAKGVSEFTIQESVENEPRKTEVMKKYEEK